MKSRLCRLFDVSRSGYYDWLKRLPSVRELANDELDQQIECVYTQHHKRYGYRRIREELLDLGIRASRERVRRRMKRLNLRGIQKRRFKQTTDSHHLFAIAPNVLDQSFVTDLPNTKWVGDITYIRVRQRWLYLAVVMDLYSRRVIGWAFGERIDAQLVCEALKMALRKRAYPKGVVMHTDRGSQYCSSAYQKLIKAHGLVSSMSGRGNCYDNAVCESFFHTLKVEHVYRLSFEDIDQARQHVFWFIEGYYNLKRKHSSLGYKSPVKFEQATLLKAA